jgi:hypothetical protein
MTLDFSCSKCEASFELELADLLEDDKLQCPNCDAKAPRDAVDGFTTALDDMFGSLKALKKSFTVNYAIESDELPPPYDREVGAEDETQEDDLPLGRLGADEDEDEESDEEETEGGLEFE